MGLPQTIYCCDQCGTRWGSDDAPREYRLANGDRVPVKSTMGWCGVCANLVAIEDNDDATATVALFETVLSRLKQGSSSPGWFKRSKPDDSFNSIDFQIADVKNAIWRLGIRKSAPKCLRCGSTEVSGATFPSQHPGCGGTVDFERSGIDALVEYDYSNPLLYDTDGKSLGRLKPTVGDIIEKQRGVTIASDGVPMSPIIPDVRQIRPARAFHCGKDYWIFLAKDAKSYAETAGAPGLTSFPYTMTLIDMGRHIPICFVTLERGLGGTVMLCMFDDTGGHTNFGPGVAYQQEDAFVQKALTLLQTKFGINPVELPPPPA